jgi:Flp pilus assembly protein TadG
MYRLKRAPRRAAAAVELAFVVLFFFIPVLFGIWEAGRLIEVQQIVSNSAREGARLAAQGYTINSTGSPTQIMTATGTPNVHDVVYQYLVAAGFTNLTPQDVVVDFAFTSPRTTDPGKGTTPTEPYLGEKNQPFTVTVTIPWSKVRWIDAGLIRPQNVSFTVTWQMLTDDAFQVNQTIPSW